MDDKDSWQPGSHKERLNSNRHVWNGFSSNSMPVGEVDVKKA